MLWGGATVSALGDGMSFVALVWLLIQRGGTPADVGWLAAVHTAPVIVGGIAAGVILDRFDPRRVLALDNVIRGVAVASVPIASAVGALSTTQLFVVAAIYGLLFMTSVAGIPSMIPRLVGPDELTTANAMESISYGIAGLIGPAVAGLVIAAVGAPVVLALDALSYGVFVVCLLAMRPTDPAGAESGEAETRQATARDVGIGPALRFILGTPAIVTITVMYMCLNLSSGLTIVVLPIYSRDVLAGGSETFGLLLSAWTAGELVGLLGVGAIGWRWPLGRSIAVATFISGLVLALWSFRPSMVPLALILAGAGITSSSLTAWAQTIRMRLIPPELRGRVFALLRTFMQSTRPIGSIVAGWLLTGGDLTPALAAIAILVVVPGAIGIWLPALGRGPTAEPEVNRASPSVVPP
jgi:MFS family permease